MALQSVESFGADCSHPLHKGFLDGMAETIKRLYTELDSYKGFRSFKAEYLEEVRENLVGFDREAYFTGLPAAQRLTDQDIRDIRSSAQSDEILGRKYNRSPRYVFRIRRGQAYRHVPVSDPVEKVAA